MSTHNENIVKMIPIEKIRILNPRDRNKKQFQKIVDNIANIGLKRPITVSVDHDGEGEAFYNLVCGQGRLEAYTVLGEDKIPAIIKNVSKEDCFLMSLIENLARRKQLNIEYARQLEILSNRGYSFSTIAKKVDTSPQYVRAILNLLKNGEERLISGVERGQIPISIAVQISTAKDENAQRALLEAYEGNKLKGRKFLKVRNLIEKRRLQGKSLFGGNRKNASENYSADSLVRAYKREAERHRLFTQKAKICEARLLFIVNALRKLFEDENYTNLLRAEKLDNFPKYLMTEINSKNGG